MRASGTMLGVLWLALLAPSGALAADTLYWDFALDEAQVKNGPEDDGSTDSPGRGTARIEYDPSGGLLRYEVRWRGLVGRLSKLHVHGPASRERSTPRHVLELLGPPEPPPELVQREGVYSGSQTLGALSQEGFPVLSAEDIVRVLKSGKAYLNLHSTIFGKGEIRGNLGLPHSAEPAAEPR
jgi:hypothetical protein